MRKRDFCALRVDVRGIELSFGWIFSLIVGGVILFLALFAASSLTNEERRVQQTVSAQEMVTQLSTVGTSLESTSRPGNISFPTQTRITPGCTLQGPFGAQEVRVERRSDLGKPWDASGIPAKESGLYLFSAVPAEGRTFSMLVKPILLPFKVGDSIALWSGTYCFVQPPALIEDDLSLLQGAGNPIVVANRVQDCVRNSTIICFANAGNIPGKKSACSIIVDVAQQSVEKQGQRVAYIDSLLYAAIFSEPALYECNVRRILRRAEFLAGLYADKSTFIASTSSQGCSSALQADLATYRALAQNGSSSSLAALFAKARELDRQNPGACPLWKEELS